MKKLNKVLAVLIILILIAGWTITVGGAGDKVGSIKDYIKLGLDLQGGVYVVMEAQTDASGEELRSLMTQTQAVIEKRVNEMGLTNPIVTIEGENRIKWNFRERKMRKALSNRSERRRSFSSS